MTNYIKRKIFIYFFNKIQLLVLKKTLKTKNNNRKSDINEVETNLDE